MKLEKKFMYHSVAKVVTNKAIICKILTIGQIKFKVYKNSELFLKL